MLKAFGIFSKYLENLQWYYLGLIYHCIILMESPHQKKKKKEYVLSLVNELWIPRNTLSSVLVLEINWYYFISSFLSLKGDFLSIRLKFPLVYVKPKSSTF